MKGKNKKGKNVESVNIAKWVKLGIILVGLVLTVVGFFVEEYSLPFMTFGILAIGITGLVHSLTSENHQLGKALGVLALTSILITWLVPYSTVSGGTITEVGLDKISLTELPVAIYYAFNLAVDKIAYVALLAMFYGVLSKTDSYSKLVTVISTKFKGKEVKFSIGVALLFMLLTTLLTQTLAVIFFVPFIISILAKLKVDKLTAFAVTFGAVLVGSIGSIYGTEALYWFNNYASLSIEDGLAYRVILFLASAILFIMFSVLRFKGTNDEKDLIEDPFVVEDNKSKTSIIPASIIMGISTILIILGYTAWQTNFGIETFNDFHTWLLELQLGEETFIFSDLIGSYGYPFGQWDVFNGIVLVIIMTILTALINRVKMDKFIENITDGFLVIIKPLLLFVVVYIVFALTYNTPIMTGISGWLFDLVNGFNPNVVAISTSLNSLFYTDLGFIGYTFGGYMTTLYADHMSIISTIYTSVFAVMQLIIPTSMLLVIGLSYTKVSYKSWIKYIWMFLVGILVIAFILINVITYVA